MPYSSQKPKFILIDQGGMHKMTYKKGDKVYWNWGNGSAEGKIEQRFTDKITRTIEGSQVTRNATKDNPAYMIAQDDGGRVLKSEGELSAKR